MTMIVFDFADIRSRMLGDDKPKPKKVEIDPVLAGLMLKESTPSGKSYVPNKYMISPKAVERMIMPPMIGVDPGRQGSEQMIVYTRIPQGEWRLMCKRLAEKLGE